MIDAGEAARIFTGAQVPPGADTIVIQENCDEADDHVTVREGNRKPGQHIRKAGLDFRTGDIALHSGRRLTARDISLAAAMNRPWLKVTRRPRIALLSTGDELVNPGDPVGPAQIIGSNGIGLAALVRAFGGEPVNLGIARDTLEDLDRAIEAALGFDMLVTSGGASVGEHDLVQTALTGRGMQLDFWKIAMRPGKPLMFGTLGALRVLGLPGNPVSTIVTALLFLRPAIDRMLGPQRRRSRAPRRAAGQGHAGQRHAPGLRARAPDPQRRRPAGGDAVLAAGQLDAVPDRARRLPDRAQAARAGSQGRRHDRHHPAQRRVRLDLITAATGWRTPPAPARSRAAASALRRRARSCPRFPLRS